MQERQIAEWREGYARHLLHIDFKPALDTHFEAEFTPLADGIRAGKSRFGPGTTFRDAELVKDGDDSLSVVVALSKTVDLELGSNRLRLGSGEASVIPHGLPAAIGSESGFTAYSITVPRAELLPLVPDLNNVCLRRMPRNSAALLLLRNYCEALGTDRVAFSPEMQRLAQRHLYELAAFAMNEPATADEFEGSAVGAARLAAARNYIAAHFRDPALDLAAVAKAQNISPRYVQKIFETAGTSFSAHVTEIRLDFAHALLLGTGPTSARISDIALHAGFSDISHFYRVFRARFGIAPGSIAKE